MNSTVYDAVIIGGGQSGLAAAYYLQQAKLNFVILEKNSLNLGSWAHYYDSLTLFSPAEYSTLPGLGFPGEADRYPHRDEVVAYLKSYAAYFNFPINYNVEVLNVENYEEIYSIQTAKNESYRTRSIICASGSFTNPNIPNLSGLNDYNGLIMYSKDYKNDVPFRNKRVIVVGGGNSAVQIAVELANTADVTIATIRPLKFVPQLYLGKDLHYWLTRTGLDHNQSLEEKRSLMKSIDGVIDNGIYQNAISQNKPDHKKMFKTFTQSGVIWDDDSQEEVDAVILATGYKPNFTYLNHLSVLDESGNPMQENGINQSSEKIYFVGLPWQTSFSSATIRGSGVDAEIVVQDLVKNL
ncbi:flavin-containing monooxygenase [Paenibacillus radicis (ex Gao et al. 2016)]|uniref:Oxidoreductase CzcO n=1 Tax=Paenibacillus radicis (ex Gao et al. 2016) TaxID=1737354 RepID=A0A917H7L8_9BACL|nr:NAD(P)/FAD-dependent oxidoreductase [Paenibacillus radicis (ex Gao et al. 2016)]GGG70359.1 putative oxidoreductase CzcO [Paenibacillus radicis (ex Gao et al. 2016)]